MKLILENWRKFVKEAIIDVVADKLSNIFKQGKLKKEVVIKTIYGDLLMECEMSQSEEFDKEYNRILNSI